MTRKISLVSLLIVICFVGDAFARPFSSLYPFGEDHEDATLTPGTKETAKVRFPTTFMRDVYKKVYIHTDGVVTFGKKINLRNKLIAPFYADLDNSDQGTIWYRHSREERDIVRASQDVIDYFGSNGFKASAVLVITWDNVPLVTNTGFSRGVTFQLILISDSRFTFAEFIYDQNEFPDPDSILPPSIGFVVSGASFFDYAVAVDDSSIAFEAARTSNVDERGIWIFQLDGWEIEGIISGYPSSFFIQGDHHLSDTGLSSVIFSDSVNIEVGGQAINGDDCSSCDAYATCVAYSGGGSCCVCQLGYIGNGKLCLSNSTYHRPNGFISGTINGQTLDRMNLHAFIITNEGRTYTAISPSPAGLNYTMQLLLPIAETVSWLFSLPKDKGINGFMATGGTLSHRARMIFDSGEEMVIEQEYSTGSNIQGDIKLDGTLPYLPKGTKIRVEPHSVDFTRRRPGLIHSYQQRSVTLASGEIISFSIDQTFDFEECLADEGEVDILLDQMRLSFTTVYAFHEANDDILRFAMISNIAPATDEAPDPCDGNICNANAECLPQGEQYSCRCNTGYEGDGFRCREADPCSRNSCDQNAVCIRDGSSYLCQCQQGFQGDGYYCDIIDPCDNNGCDINAECEAVGDLYRCRCRQGFQGDGYSCQLIFMDPCLEHDCHDNAQCVPSDSVYDCECNPGYQGDGYLCEIVSDTRCDFNQCDDNARCIPSGLSYYCTCNPGYDGNGFTCTVPDPCDDSPCDSNAECRSSGDSYICRCYAGYDGDGFSCTYDPCYNNPCDDNARCTRMPGGTAMCSCNAGFEGDGYTCESQRVLICSSCDANALCIPESRGYRCVCNAGYEGNGRECNDLDECTRGRDIACGANADCVNTIGSYSCTCQPGFAGDGYTCRERPPVGDGMLVFGQGMSVMKQPLNPDEKGGRVIMKKRQTVVGLSYDCVDGYIYWTDITKKSINRVKPDGTAYRRVVKKGLSSPEGVAIDPWGRNLYWTDSGFDRIEVSNLDGRNRRVLIDTDLVNPRAIMADAIEGYLYWTDWNRDAPKIERAYMDGSNREVLVESGLRLPNGLTIDQLSNKLCWADAGSAKLECIDLDGNPLTRRAIFTNAEYPFGLASFDQNLYWTDWSSNSILSVNHNGGLSAESMDLPLGGAGMVHGITAAASCSAGYNACSENNGGCSNLCLPIPGRQRTCACPTDTRGNEIQCN